MKVSQSDKMVSFTLPQYAIAQFVGDKNIFLLRRIFFCLGAQFVVDKNISKILKFVGDKNMVAFFSSHLVTHNPLRSDFLYLYFSKGNIV